MKEMKVETLISLATGSILVIESVRTDFPLNLLGIVFSFILIGKAMSDYFS